MHIEKHTAINDIKISEHCFLYTVYADGRTFVLKDSQSIAHLVEIFNTFSFFSVLKPNLKKCETGLGKLEKRCILLISF